VFAENGRHLFVANRDAITLQCWCAGALPTAISFGNRSHWLTVFFMRTFGGFRSVEQFFYGEVRGDDVHVLAKRYWTGIELTGDVRKLADLRVELPVAPSKLIAVGLNYSDHIAEMKRTELGAPLIWFKAPSSLLPDRGTIEIAFPEHRTDFEVELAVVIGARTKNVSVNDALDHVFGYTIGLDITDRDLQNQEKQFGRCKSFDTYTPIGPFVYAHVDVSNLPMELQQNGEMRQQTRTSRMIHSVAQIVSFTSESLTLLPGDVILTGTPSGVGPIQAGDELGATIGNWPPLYNRVANTGDRIATPSNSQLG
jgi:2-keto-4-pentenoate hydratase/2-oxohepta-3-ene-1,7-dioic acid hydratase in catechol pathway